MWASNLLLNYCPLSSFDYEILVDSFKFARRAPQIGSSEFVGCAALGSLELVLIQQRLQLHVGAALQSPA
jgi:hypothetical protein